MSTDHVAARGGHDHSGASHGSLRGYLTGFVLAAILTFIPFWLVMSGVLGSQRATELSIAALAIVQIVVHMIYFLHMDTRSEGGWLMMALIFTVIIVVIGLVGSIWVMYHLNANMMPGQAISQLP